MGGYTGSPYLEAGHFEATLAYRYLHADEMFLGDTYQPQFQQGGTNADITIHSWDLSLTFAPIKRLDLTLTLPFIYASGDIVSNRLHMSATGLGDLRFVADTWIFDPEKHVDGNLSLGVGVKAPTGEDNYKNIVYFRGAQTDRPVDPALQPGDGAWGLVADLFGFQKLFTQTYGYVSGSYIFSTRGQTDTEFTTIPQVHLDAPDTYSGRAGLTYLLWPEQGLSLNLGGRVEGVPVRNIITGADHGFRRPGYAVYIEPGIAWTTARTIISISGPVAVDRNRERSIRDLGTHTSGVGAIANFQILASFSYRF